MSKSPPGSAPRRGCSAPRRGASTAPRGGASAAHTAAGRGGSCAGLEIYNDGARASGQRNAVQAVLERVYSSLQAGTQLWATAHLSHPPAPLALPPCQGRPLRRPARHVRPRGARAGVRRRAAAAWRMLIPSTACMHRAAQFTLRRPRQRLRARRRTPSPCCLHATLDPAQPTPPTTCPPAPPLRPSLLTLPGPR